VIAVPAVAGATDRWIVVAVWRPVNAGEAESRLECGDMPDVVFTVDQAKSMRDQAIPGHNRWHPDIPVATMVRPGQNIRVECREWTDGQIGNNDSANDVRDVDLNRAHMLSGPIGVEGAEPGDLLVIDILDLGPVQPPQEYGDAPGQGWGYTGVFAKANGGGFLTDYFPDAYKAVWDFQGQVATSRHIPGVRYTGLTHPGLFGTAPSADLLTRWNRREKALADTDPDRVPALALLPLEDQTLGGQADGDVAGRIARDGARTVPARVFCSSGGSASGGTRSGSVAMRSRSRRFHRSSSSADGAVPNRPGCVIPV
jgi:formamidase